MWSFSDDVFIGPLTYVLRRFTAFTYSDSLPVMIFNFFFSLTRVMTCQMLCLDCYVLIMQVRQQLGRIDGGEVCKMQHTCEPTPRDHLHGRLPRLSRLVEPKSPQIQEQGCFQGCDQH
jgi:hypothetical protein